MIIMDVRREDYFRNPLTDVIKVPAIYTVHYFRYGKNFKFPLETHPFWELVFIDSGKATVAVPDTAGLTLKYGALTVTVVLITEGAYSGYYGINMKDVIDNPSNERTKAFLKKLEQ